MFFFFFYTDSEIFFKPFRDNVINKVSSPSLVLATCLDKYTPPQSEAYIRYFVAVDAVKQFIYVWIYFFQASYRQHDSIVQPLADSGDSLLLETQKTNPVSPQDPNLRKHPHASPKVKAVFGCKI